MGPAVSRPCRAARLEMMSLLAMSSQSSPMPGLCRDQLSRLCGGVLNTVLAVPVILVTISVGVEAAAQDTNVSGTDTPGTDTSGTDTSVSTFVMPVQTGTAMPADACISGNGWICFTGFARDETGACRRLVVSANATVRNNRWTCNPGFLRSEDDACKKI